MNPQADGQEDGGVASGKSGRGSTGDNTNQFDGQKGQASGPVHRPTIESIVLLTRDRTLTSKIIDSLVTTLYDAEEQEAETESNSKVIIPGTGGTKTVVLSRRRFKGPDGKVRLVNQDVEWSLRVYGILFFFVLGRSRSFGISLKLIPQEIGRMHGCMGQVTVRWIIRKPKRKVGLAEFWIASQGQPSLCFLPPHLQKRK
ncbi:hypothetical protein BC829DRAFT_279657 [Chytridium lagenaria]|nr:hypothetical protein BC829DRAFT_279657 [Chytridium lagenaria]